MFVTVSLAWSVGLAADVTWVKGVWDVKSICQELLPSFVIGLILVGIAAILGIGSK